MLPYFPCSVRLCLVHVSKYVIAYLSNGFKVMLTKFVHGLSCCKLVDTAETGVTRTMTVLAGRSLAKQVGKVSMILKMPLMVSLSAE